MKATLPSWSKLPLLLALLLLAPRVGLAAAEDAPLAPAPTSTTSAVPGTDERSPLRLLEEPSVQPRRQRIPVGVRLLAEAGAGLVTAAAAGLAGGAVGYGLCAAAGGESRKLGCLLELALGAFVGGGLGYPLGVWWGGEAAGGDGSLLASFAGMGVGALIGMLLGGAVQQVDSNGQFVTLTAGLTTLAGPILFYELFQRREPGPPAPTVASARPHLQPLLSVSPNGALLGLGGTF